VDCGLDEAALQDRVRLGDAVAFAQPPIRLGDSWLVSPRLDNRVSLVALTQCLEALAQERPAWDFVAAAVVREETDDAGSTTSAYALAPQAAVVLDTTFGRTPDLPEHASFALGAGLSNAWGPAVHPAMFRLLEQAARSAGVDLTPEFLPNLTQTDADHIQLVLAGVPTAVISIPILNMHTPGEIVDLGDIEQAARLLTVFARELGHNLHLELTHD
ncbi:MAG: M20/M25/M40 family metallo-hydrolase, partial [Anaerolineales bacterium]|nr:M20/M25/M40 family metallo-hydrolase [Anaerolineales bacterium]